MRADAHRPALRAGRYPWPPSFTPTTCEAAIGDSSAQAPRSRLALRFSRSSRCLSPAPATSSCARRRRMRRIRSRLPALRPGQTACEGPLISHGPARSVGVWGTSGAVRAHLTVTVQDAATHAVLAAGALGGTPGDGERVAHLVQDAPGGRPLRGLRHRPGGASSPSTARRRARRVSWRPGCRRARSSRWPCSATVIERCSAPCRPHSPGHRCGGPAGSGPGRSGCCVIALLATFGLAVVAVVSAAGDDDAPAPPFDFDRPGPDEPSGDDLSEAGQDRPQPVS